MWIMEQNEKSLYNIEKFSGIHVIGFGNAYNITGIDKDTAAEIELGKYPTEDRAKEVLISLLTDIDKTRFVMPN